MAELRTDIAALTRVIRQTRATRDTLREPAPDRARG
jgi:hypothetical protein